MQHSYTYTLLGSTTFMVINRKEAISNAIRDELLQDMQKLSYSELYKEVVKKLAVTGKTKNKISYRDYSAVLESMLKERKVSKEDSGKRGSKVYYSLTDSSKKQYQRDILGIDEEKQRLRELYQLLFFYEVGKYGKIYFTREEDFSGFLESVGLSVQNLKPFKTVEAPEVNVRLTYFEHVKGIFIAKHELILENVTTYSITLPGFTRQEIVDYYKKNSKRQRLTYSPDYLGIFSHIKFTESDLISAFQTLKTAHLIKRIPTFSADLDPNISSRHIRYTIADNRLRELISGIWKIYHEIHTILFMKSSIGELEDRDKKWLRYLFGDWNTEKLLQEWCKKSASILKHHSDKDMEILGMKETIFGSLHKVKKQIKDLNKKYNQVLKEYGFPMTLINELIKMEDES